jgi:hypothetical protein
MKRPSQGRIVGPKREDQEPTPDIEIARSLLLLASWLGRCVRVASWARAGAATLGAMAIELSGRFHFTTTATALATLGMVFTGSCIGRHFDR